MNTSKSGTAALITVPEIDRIRCSNCGITFERLASNHHHDLCQRCEGWTRAFFAQEAVTRALRQARGGRRRGRRNRRW